MLGLKPGVSLKGLQPQTVLMALIVEGAYAARGVPCVITSCADGKHGANSLHYQGLALDFRTHTVPEESRPELVLEIRKALGEEFDVIWEAQGGANEHVHIEFDPKPKPDPGKTA